ncbi:hypothetical protein ACFPAG_16260 [Vogesella sp. GCM10023246]|uniref:Acetylornithine deacetylase n=1 Tax=Vogesella oryzagri TaxID=3160864 RepID=A0ABV1M834_9NEIS
MSTPAMLAHLLLERLSPAVLAREPEPQALMEDAEQIRAFMLSGQGNGILNYIYLFHAIMSLPVIRPGDIGSIDQAHKPDEWLALDQLSACDTLLATLLQRLGGQG